MPRLWKDTIEEHRAEVRDAILDGVAALVAAHGLHGVTMSALAEKSGVGRATLYKYFPDLEAAMSAWHERIIGEHLAELHALDSTTRPPVEKLRAVLERFALVCFEHDGTELTALLHRGAHMAHAQRHLRELVGELVAAGAKAGALRRDVPAADLAAYCLHALTAASGIKSKGAALRLVDVTLGALKPAR